MDDKHVKGVKKHERRHAELIAMHADILELMATTEALSATLRADLLELGLRPGGSEYKVVEEHFAKLAN
jgi:hypothetical protein